MDWLIFIVWISINIPAIIWIMHHVLLSENPPLLVALAPMWSICGCGAISKEVSLAGRIILTIFYTAFLLPAVVAYYVIMLMVLIIFAIAALFLLIFKKRNRHR